MRAFVSVTLLLGLARENWRHHDRDLGHANRQIKGAKIDFSIDLNGNNLCTIVGACSVTY